MNTFTHIPGRLLMFLVVIACLSALTGCGGGGKGASPAPGSVTQGGSVEDQLGFTRKGIASAQAKVENSIAACMKALGFEYVPGDPVAVQAALTGKPDMSDEEFEKQFGYGITTLYGRGSVQTDPNSKIRARLGSADLRAYEIALSGGTPEQTFALAIDTGDFTELGGCTKRATDELLGGTQLLATLQRKLDELDESIVTDQRMVRAFEDWTTCMRDATGESFEDSEAIEDSIKKRFEAVIGPALPPGQVAAEGSYDKAALVELQRSEVDLSTKDVACERKHITPVEEKVRTEKETRFRERNADLLGKVKPLGS